MLHPLLLDVLNFSLPLVLGGLAFACGRCLHRWPRSLRICLIALAIIVIAVVTAALWGTLPDETSDWLSWIWGATVVLAWMALFLLGVVWSVPGRSFSTGFLAVLVVVAEGMVLMEASGPLWWRFCAPRRWERTANKDGALQQSNGLTCSPAAAVMLLHQHGIKASEGEMAYLARTSLLGTEVHDMARALSLKVRERGGRAVVLSISYDACIQQRDPFIAHVVDPQYGGHALLILSAKSEEVDVLDPLDGRRRQIPRRDFEQMWGETVIIVTGFAR